MEPLENDTKVTEVQDRTRHGISWNLVGAIVTNGMRFAVIAVLGRALESRDFGVVAAALSVNAVLYSIRDLGVGLALVQRKTLAPEHLTTAFAMSAYLGLGLAAALVLGAPWIADLYNMPESTDVIRALALLFAMRGVSITSRMVCQRAMDFRRIAIVEMAAFTTGSVTSIVLAVYGAGPWSLVAGYLVEEALATCIFLVAYPPKVSLRLKRSAVRDLMSFGTGQTIAQVAGVVAIYGDNFVVGHTLGAQSLGYYTRAYDLIKLPSTIFAAVVGNVLFPAYARLQDDKAQLAASFRRVTYLNALVLLPVTALAIVLAPEVIFILMGSGWDAAVLPFQILALSILMRTSQKFTAVIATAANLVNAVAIAYLVLALCVVGGAAISIQWGILGVAITTAFAITVSNIECTYLAMRVSGLPARDVLAAHGDGLMLSLILAGCAIVTADQLRDIGGSAVLVVGGTLAVAAVVTVVAIALGVRAGRRDLLWIVAELRRIRSRRHVRT